MGEMNPGGFIARLMTSALVWRDREGLAWCQFPGEPPERLHSQEEIEKEEIMKNTHLLNRCGTCQHWDSWQLGIGYCHVDRTEDPPIRLLEGSLETRIDFGCKAYEFDESKTKAKAKAADDDDEPLMGETGDE